jgi:3',5'-cyclic AMP phosphodiesterase CpdA
MPKTLRFITLGICFCLFFSGISINTIGASILIGPYSQHSELDSIIVSWQTETSTTQNEVHWGTSASLGNITEEKNMFPRTFHSVEIKGLQANQKYFYSVISDGIASPLYTFWTAFEPNETIRFVVYGDTRGGWDNWQNTLLVSQAIEKENPPVVLHTGDLVDNGKNADDWINFFSASPFIYNSTLYPVLGNHENYGHSYFTFFSLPFNERWYSFHNGPVHFIALDSNLRSRYRFTQFFWLLYELNQDKYPFTIVLFHHPPYSSGSEHGNSNWVQRFWVPVFEHFQVDIVFNGHDHDYERSIVQGITYVVTGGGGAPLYDVGQSPWTVYSEKTYHYCLLTVNSSTLIFEAKKPDGSVFDSFILTK